MVGFRHMRLAAIALLFSALLLGQTAPGQSAPGQTSQDLAVKALQERLKNLKLIEPSHFSIQQAPAASNPKLCAIPLLNALPANNKAENKMPIVKPPENVEHTKAMTSQLGLPACEPGWNAAKPPEAEKK